LFFERRFSKKIGLFAYNQTFWPPKFFAPPNFWAGYATERVATELTLPRTAFLKHLWVTVPQYILVTDPSRRNVAIP